MVLGRVTCFVKLTENTFKVSIKGFNPHLALHADEDVKELIWFWHRKTALDKISIFSLNTLQGLDTLATLIMDFKSRQLKSKLKTSQLAKKNS